MKLVRVKAKGNERWVNPDAVDYIIPYATETPNAWSVIHFRNGESVSVDMSAKELSVLLADGIFEDEG